MRVLYTSFIEPSEKFGGGLVILQTLSSLSSFAEIDYIGLEYDEKEFEKYNIKIDNRVIIKPTNSKRQQLFNAVLFGATSSYYTSWKRAVENFNPEDYDFVYMDFTRQGFVAKWAHDNNIPLVIRAHNSESDYAKSIYSSNKNIKTFLRVFTAKYNEKLCVNYASKVIVITQYEKKRFIELYGNKDKYSVIPVCVKTFKNTEGINNSKKYILITGSLWFGPNYDGTIWFLKNVWDKIQYSIGSNYDLVVAGAKPNEEIKRLCNMLENVKLYESPDDIEPFYVGASLYIAPVFYGAGMKVKVAEALSCGLSVIATRHALIGYEEADDYTFKADSSDEYIEAINQIIRIENDTDRKEKIKSIFNENYSLESSLLKLRKIVYSLDIRKYSSW